MHKYNKAFIGNDNERFPNFLSEVSKNFEKMNAEDLFPYEIILEYNGLMTDIEKKLMEARWNNLDRTLSNNKTIIVRDGSESMSCDNCFPIKVVTSSAILFSENLSKEFKNKFIIFSRVPKLIELSDSTLYGKLKKIYQYNDYTNKHCKVL